eukprot:6123380-Pyramimonas_sp.AAC.1
MHADTRDAASADAIEVGDDGATRLQHRLLAEQAERPEPEVLGRHRHKASSALGAQTSVDRWRGLWGPFEPPKLSLN